MTALPPLTAIVNGTPNDATQVDGNFDIIKAHIDAELINRDGSVAMTAALTLPADPSAALEAATKQYVDASYPKILVLERTSGFLATNNAQINWESETNDYDGMWSSGSTVTIAEDGVYIISVELDCSSAASINDTLRISWTNGGTSTMYPNPILGSETNTSSSIYQLGYPPVILQAGRAFTISFGISGSALGVSNARMTVTKLGAI